MKLLKENSSSYIKYPQEPLILNENYLYEMTMLRHEDTGLASDIWLDDMGIGRNLPHHEPRLKIQADLSKPSSFNNLIPISISKNPMIKAGADQLRMKGKQLKEIIEYIKNNQDLFLDYYYKNINLYQLLSELVKRDAYKIK